MKYKRYIIYVAAFWSASCSLQHIEQAEPLENVIKAQRRKSTKLFRRAFSPHYFKMEDSIWYDRLEQSRGKLHEYFGENFRSKISYKYDSIKSELIVLISGEEKKRFKVFQKDNHWYFKYH